MLSRFFPGGTETIGEVFRDATGTSLNDYQALCFATLARYIEFTLEKYQSNPSDFLLTQGWYRTVSLPEETIVSFLKDISASKLLLRQRTTAPMTSPASRISPSFTIVTFSS